MKNVILSIVVLLLLIAGLIVEYFEDKRRGQNTLDGVGLTWMMAALVAFILAFCIVGSHYAQAHDHEHPELNAWYQSLHSDIGPCCDGTDAVHLADPEWATQEKCLIRSSTDDSPCYSWSHYRVFIDNQWIDVPDSAVVTGPNKDGRALVWPFRSPMAEKANIRCFMPGTMS